MAARLDKVLAHAGRGTRREVSALIRAGRVTVNGALQRDAACKVDPARDTVAVDGETLCIQENRYLMLNKPLGVVCATQDNFQRTVLELVPQELRRALFPVGRLDKDTEGLLFLTTDGAFSHALTSPRHHVDKVYLASIEGVLSPDATERFAAGLPLADGTACRPAMLSVEERTALGCIARITICEGRFHQVRRMVRAVGGEVTALRRLSVGAVSLDPALPAGGFRPLREDEIAALLRKNN